MTTQTEALKMALEALERCGSESYTLERDAITAIKKALAQPEQDKERCLGCEACIDTACGRDECPKGWPKAAQPEQEPVEWGVDWGPDGNSVSIIKRLAGGGIEVVGWEYAPHPLQRTWVGLTQTEVVDLLCEYNKLTGNVGWQQLIYMTEAKLKAKNKRLEKNT